MDGKHGNGFEGDKGEGRVRRSKGMWREGGGGKLKWIYKDGVDGQVCDV